MGQTSALRARVGIIQAGKLIGCKVENPQGQTLGKIEDLMLDVQENRIAYAVLSFGGFLGFGDKLFPIPMDALMLHSSKGTCILDVDKEKLKSAPGYDKKSLPDVNDRTWTMRIYSHYGSRPYWEE